MIGAGWQISDFKFQSRILNLESEVGLGRRPGRRQIEGRPPSVFVAPMHDAEFQSSDFRFTVR
jgi:hypothetical protein